MTTLPHRTHLLVAASVLGLVLAGCAGTTTTTDPVGNADGLPTAEDLGAEDDGGAVTSGMCAQDEPDCQDTIVEDGGEVSSPVCAPDAPDCEEMVVTPDGAAGSCLAGDEDCTDESHDGQDVARPVRLVDGLDEQEEVTPATRGATDGASARRIEQATLLDEDTVRLAVIGNPCMLVEDVLVTESPAEVRVLVLAGLDATVEACEDVGLWWSVDVDLDRPLGDRTLQDLAG